ncbi:vacuolar lysine transporter YPQ1 isoform X2 [Nicotiana tabacum]|uniref:Probable vacuolar amino acid transporter YPQ3 isoform X2 n=1 Tax=Nicotiana tabacum TaxID=4097 RepID=A0A1S4CWN2_TOBAC|nr:PREDICTED: probable vacuolar amino acid transporter YPQ3 isoform X2 [Nicotiana tabacum]
MGEMLNLGSSSSMATVSLALGLISVVSWGVAEIPQIITNYKQKSTEGLSLFFLFAWIVGDLFNLFGCMLEPATLYTVTTLILTSQTLYYAHIYPRLESNRRWHEVSESGDFEKISVHNHGVDESKSRRMSSTSGFSQSSPISLPGRTPIVSSGGDLYYMSARSLSMSHTPTAGSFPSHKTPPLDAEFNFKEPLLEEIRATNSPPPPHTKRMLCLVSIVTWFLSAVNVLQQDSMKHNLRLQKPTSGIVLQVGRKLQQVNMTLMVNSSTTNSGGVGSFLGWGMAAIYMGGRLPQICLNIRRGNVEGLNPLMFIFALLGNTTYVASILASSLDWSKIGPNLPWLVDAAGCVLLDTFILIQFVYFRYWTQRDQPD